MKNFIETKATVSFFGVVADTIQEVEFDGKYILGSRGRATRITWRYELASLSTLKFLQESRCYYL